MSFEIYKRLHYPSDNEVNPLSLSSSVFVDYVPMYSIDIYHNTLTVNNGLLPNENLLPDNEFIYSKLIHKSDSRLSRYSDLFEKLNGGRSFKSISYVFKKDDEEHKIFAAKGAIFNEIGEVLLMLTVKKNKFKSLYQSIKNLDAIDHNDLKLFVSKEFFSVDKYSKLWKKIEKDYYYDAIQKNIDVEIIPSSVIESIVYNDGLTFDFPTITDFQNFLNIDLHESLINYSHNRLERIEQQRIERRERREREREERRLRERQENIDNYTELVDELLHDNPGAYNRTDLITFGVHLITNNPSFESGFESLTISDDERTLDIWSNSINHYSYNYNDVKDYMFDNLNIVISEPSEDDEIIIMIEEEGVDILPF